jgi:hypothetical protein
MKRKLSKVEISKYTNKPFKVGSGIFRILDQNIIDRELDNEGSCQVCALASAVEWKYKVATPYRQLKTFYTTGDTAYNGRIEKVGRVMSFSSVYGLKSKSRVFFAKDIESLGRTQWNYDSILNAIRSKDCVIIGLSRNSAFFSGKTGKLYDQIRIPYGHAMRLIEKSGVIYAVNSWGEDWGMSGLGEIPRNKFNLLKVWELKACNFREEQDLLSLYKTK